MANAKARIRNVGSVFLGEPQPAPVGESIAQYPCHREGLTP